MTRSAGSPPVSRPATTGSTFSSTTQARCITATRLTLAGQVLGPFVLTKLLLPQLLRAAPSRVIVMSVGGHVRAAAGPFGQADGSRRLPGGDGLRARAKRAQVALSAEWARRIPAEDVAFHAMHPGWADTPGVATSLPAFHRLLRPILRTPEEGADTAIWLASAGPNQLGSGKLWHDRRPRRMRLFGGPAGRDAQLAGQLWDQLDAEAPPAAKPQNPRKTPGVSRRGQKPLPAGSGRGGGRL